MNYKQKQKRDHHNMIVHVGLQVYYGVEDIVQRNDIVFLSNLYDIIDVGLITCTNTIA
jgi:hypothetical protein